MSGFRRHLMAKLAQQQYIEGYCNVYNDTFTFMPFVNGTRQTVTVATDANGYWKWTPNDVVDSLASSFSNISQSESDKLVSIKFNLNSVTSFYECFGRNNGYPCVNLIRIDNMKGALIGSGLRRSFYGCESLEYVDVRNLITYNIQYLDYTFHNCKSLKEINGIGGWNTSSLTNMQNCFSGCYSLESDNDNPFDLSRWNTANLTNMQFIFTSTNSESNAWYNDKGWNVFSKLKDVRLFDIPNGCTINNNFLRFYGGQDNYYIGSIGTISGTITFSNADLNLQSAINILSALSDLQGGAATITFATSTQNLISADSTAMALVAQAQVYGWTITGF